MLDNLIIKYASPTLTGIKTGNLFKISNNDTIDLNKEIENYNLLLNCLDLYLDIVYSCDKYSLIYIYRLKMLLNDLDNKDVMSFLKSCGYNGFTVKEHISYLKNRFELINSTPHEVGIFLGYPLNDVKCFIKFKGKNFKISGCWKVYDNVNYCRNKFESFKKCKEILSYLYKQDYPLESLVFIGNQ